MHLEFQKFAGVTHWVARIALCRAIDFPGRVSTNLSSMHTRFHVVHIYTRIYIYLSLYITNKINCIHSETNVQLLIRNVSTIHSIIHPRHKLNRLLAFFFFHPLLFYLFSHLFKKKNKTFFCNLLHCVQSSYLKISKKRDVCQYLLVEKFRIQKTFWLHCYNFFIHFKIKIFVSKIKNFNVWK